MSVTALANDMVSSSTQQDAPTDFLLSTKGGLASVNYGDAVSEQRVTQGADVFLFVDETKIPEGQAFLQWNVTKGDFALDYPQEVNSYFTMPAMDLEISAQYAKAYPIVIHNGETYDNRTSYPAGVNVSIYYDEGLVPAGKVFKRWKVTKGDVRLDDESNQGVSFVMPEEAVEIEAVLVDGKKVDVTTGHVNGTHIEKGYALPGSEVYLQIQEEDIPEGQAFKRWKVTKGNVEIYNSDDPENASFFMPNEDVVIEPEFTTGYRVNITHGSVDGGQMHAAGSTITIHYDEYEEHPGLVFKQWTVSPESVVLSNPTDKRFVTFTMPAQDVTINAELVAARKLDVTYGEAMGDHYENGYAMPESRVSISFDAYSVPENKGFKRWKVTKGNLELENSESDYYCDFIMPDEDIAIEAELLDGHTIQVIDGSCDTNGIAIMGREVTLSYDGLLTPEGKVFKNWKVKSGNVTLRRATQKNYCTFIMPDEPVIIEPEYQDGVKTTALYGIQNGDYYEHEYAAAGSSVMLRLDEESVPKGKAFKQWKVTKGNVVLSDPTDLYHQSYIMPNEEVQIEAELVDGHRVTVKHGDSDKAIYRAQGDHVAIYYSPYDIPLGKVFGQWHVTQGHVDLHHATSKNQCTFVMGNEDVVIEPEFEDGHRVFAQAGYVHADSEQDYIRRNTVVEVQFDMSRKPPRKQFSYWKVVEGNVELLNPTSQNCKFIMPNEDVRLEPVYKDAHFVDIKDGEVNRGNRGRYYAPNEKVTLHFNREEALPGKVFMGWNVVSKNTTVHDATEGDFAYFIMPDDDVVIEPIYENGYKVNVINGTSMVMDSFKAGDEVCVRADDTLDGQGFDHWEVVKGNIELQHPRSKDYCWFVMPDEEVSVKAVYKDQYKVIQHYKDEWENIDYVKEHHEATLAVNSAINGHAIAGWKTNDEGIEIKRNWMGHYYFTMPARDVEVEPILAPGKRLDVLHGFAQCADPYLSESTAFFVPGKEVRLCPNADQEPLVFKEWHVKKGHVKLSNRYAEFGCTFIMPDEEVIIEAIYTLGNRIDIYGGYDAKHSQKEDQIVYYKAGDRLYFRHDPSLMQPNQAFDHWTCNDPKVVIHEVEGQENLYYLIVPEHDVKVQAVYTNTGHTIQVNLNGASGGHYEYLTNYLHKDGRRIQVPYVDGVVKEDHLELKAWQINGQLYEPGSMIQVHDDIVMKAIWQEKDEHNYYALYAPLTSIQAKNLDLESKYSTTRMIKAGNVVSVQIHQGQGPIVAQEEDVKITYHKESQSYTFVMPDHPVHLCPTGANLIHIMYDYNGGRLHAHGIGSYDGEANYAVMPTIAMSIHANGQLLSNQSSAIAQEIRVFDHAQPMMTQEGLEVIHPEHKQFEGWYCDGKIYQTKDSYLVSKNTTFVAVWTDEAERAALDELKNVVKALDDPANIKRAKELYDSLSYYVKYLVSEEDVKAMQDAQASHHQAIENSIVPSAYSISLQDRISLNLYLTVTPSALEDQQAYIETQVMDGNTLMIQKVMVSDLEKAGDYYRIRVPLNARQMNDQVTMKIYTTRFDGSVQASKPTTYSIMDYANSLLVSRGLIDQNIIDVVEAMLNYGAVSQQYFNYKTNQLANKKVLNKAYTTVDVSAFDDYQPTITDTLDGMEYGTTNIRLKSETVIRHHFLVDETIKQRYEEGSITFTLVNEQGVVKELQPTFYGKDKVYVEVENIYAVDLGTMYHVQITDTTNNQHIDVISSVLSYGYAVLRDDSVSEKAKDLVKAMYVYNQKAIAYKNAK